MEGKCRIIKIEPALAFAHYCVNYFLITYATNQTNYKPQKYQ